MATDSGPVSRRGFARASLAAGAALLVGRAVAVQADPVPKGAGRGNPDEIKKRVYGSWKEVRRETADGATDDPFQLLGYEFAPDGWVTWCRRGELSGLDKGASVGVRVDPLADPMRIDFLTEHKNTIVVTPCIFRFDGTKLEIVEPTTGGYQPLHEDGDYPNRPTSFTCTKQNKYVKTVLVTCTKLDQD